MKCMVRFNFCIGCQLCFSLLDFWPACKWRPSWRVWGISHLLYLVYDGLPHILLCHLSVFPMAKWCNGEIIPDGAVMMVRLFRRGNLICALKWILSLDWTPPPQNNCTGRQLKLELISSFRDRVPGDMSRGAVPGLFFTWGKYWQKLTHYWDGNFPRKCLGISCYKQPLTIRTSQFHSMFWSYKNEWLKMFICLIILLN